MGRSYLWKLHENMRRKLYNEGLTFSFFIKIISIRMLNNVDYLKVIKVLSFILFCSLFRFL